MGCEAYPTVVSEMLRGGISFRRLPILDFSAIRGKRRDEYFAAVRAGWGHDYAPMERMFSGVISRTLRISGSR
jgi:hypothetical protein